MFQMSDKQDQKLSVSSTLTLIEHMSYDDKQLLTKRLINRHKIYVIGKGFSCECYFIEDDIIKACRTFAKDNKYITVQRIHGEIACNKYRCYCNIDNKFFVCYKCKESICFICKENVSLQDHLTTHSVDEIPDDLLIKYIKICYYVDEYKPK